DDPAARQAGATIRTRSPLSVAVTWEGLRRARHMTLLEVLDADGELARRFGEVPDFREGIRAQVIDKDHDPHWSHSRVEDVTADEVAALLGPDA
ncbi:MAG TPA: enoyl-CoA hydratase/isomerase family protein, partial [Candidatus Avipropionibacterium avicola]|nr:enoyl-CoA hydratase/isomerase family protein [Candidatus Avipropionibacterium avicola]